jgi:hypothetical protein
MGDQKSDPPGAVSSQNQEEGESALRDDERHPEPRSRGRANGDREHAGDSGGDAGDSGGDAGAAGEGSQSTGHPESAG